MVVVELDVVLVDDVVFVEEVDEVVEEVLVLVTLKYVLNYSRAKNKLFFDPGASFKMLVF